MDMVEQIALLIAAGERIQVDGVRIVQLCAGAVSIQDSGSGPPAVSVTSGAGAGAQAVFRVLARHYGEKAVYRLWITPDRSVRLPIEMVLHPEPDPYEEF